MYYNTQVSLLAYQSGKDVNISCTNGGDTCNIYCFTNEACMDDVYPHIRCDTGNCNVYCDRMNNIQCGDVIGTNVDYYNITLLFNPVNATTNAPTQLPSTVPSSTPTNIPTTIPSDTTAEPSLQPTMIPSVEPTIIPSTQPSLIPTQPTNIPSIIPTDEPTNEPTELPSGEPSMSPTVSPSDSGGVIGENTDTQNQSMTHELFF